jgi:CheY-like chemotaxis protein
MSPRILVLDDELSICRLIQAGFAELGVEVVCSQEAEEALAVLGHRRFDGLIVDLHLSAPWRTEGLDLIAEARWQAPELRIVVHTGDCDDALFEECLRAGADEVVPKGEPLARLRGAVLGRASLERSPESLRVAS